VRAEIAGDAGDLALCEGRHSARWPLRDNQTSMTDQRIEQGLRLEQASHQLAEARHSAADAVRQVKPALRGVVHQWAFLAALAAGAALVVLAPEGEARIAAAIYALSLAAVLGTSALYHRVNWSRAGVRSWMRRLDHSMIFLLIAGTVTPFALLVMDGPLATALLVGVWSAAAAGIILGLIWAEAPNWVSAAVYVAVGWIGAAGFPEIWAKAGIGAGALVALGGVLYTAGAVVYARQRPDPSPSVFGYHEVFHVLVVVAAVAHFTAIAIYAMPSG
jgi:hemolysin III